MTGAIPGLAAAVAAPANAFAFVGRMFVIGRGLEFATAREVALKLKETCRIAAEPFTATDLVHGPIAALDPLFPCGRSHRATMPSPRCSKRVPECDRQARRSWPVETQRPKSGPRLHARGARACAPRARAPLVRGAGAALRRCSLARRGSTPTSRSGEQGRAGRRQRELPERLDVGDRNADEPQRTGAVAERAVEQVAGRRRSSVRRRRRRQASSTGCGSRSPDTGPSS